jgi:hypothetical protein
MKVLVYVEGDSDRRAMSNLLAPLIARKQRERVKIDFVVLRKGDGKKNILIKVPKQAALTIINDPEAVVVAMPDLYPYNKGFPHTSYQEMKTGIINTFTKELEKKTGGKGGKQLIQRYEDRFHVFCFKHDLEALILAAKKELCDRLQVENIKVIWKLPVEDQDNNNPPKRIIEELFKQHNQKYQGTADAPLILGAADYIELCEKCPQCFKPFVEFLESVH